VGLIQLMFMLLFTANFIPDACSLARMFKPAGGNSRCNLSAAGVEETVDDGNGTRTGWKNVASRSAPLFLWLVWPTVLFAGSIVGWDQPVPQRAELGRRTHAQRRLAASTMPF